MKKQQENVKKLLELIEQFPNYEIIPMVNYEICCDDSNNYWIGGWDEAHVDKYYRSDECCYLKDSDEEELLERTIDFLSNENKELSIEELEEMAQKMIDSYEWKDCIVVYIELP